MNCKELVEVLNNEKIPKTWYSINDFLEPDAFILRKIEENYWEFFYMDERGGQNNDFQIFGSEEDACKYMLNQLLRRKSRCHSFRA